MGFKLGMSSKDAAAGAPAVEDDDDSADDVDVTKARTLLDVLTVKKLAGHQGVVCPAVIYIMRPNDEIFYISGSSSTRARGSRAQNFFFCMSCHTPHHRGRSSTLWFATISEKVLLSWTQPAW